MPDVSNNVLGCKDGYNVDGEHRTSLIPNPVRIFSTNLFLFIYKNGIFVWLDELGPPAALASTPKGSLVRCERNV